MALARYTGDGRDGFVVADTRGMSRRICGVKQIVLQVEWQEPFLSKNCRAREAWKSGEFTAAELVRRAGGLLDGVASSNRHLGPVGFLVCLKQRSIGCVVDVGRLEIKTT